ncbi:hypothetical protein [Streptomyces sp. NPDC094466]|uniref:hypothetical protein n=1 Tax=Streptomyces sp. NPDC094466 TaxID=3366065 RepID=UPI00381C5DAA
MLLELIAALDGGVRERADGVPRAQEDLLAGLDVRAETGDASAPVASPAGDERTSAPGELVPFSALLPYVSALALDRELTTRLVGRCRAEGWPRSPSCATTNTPGTPCKPSTPNWPPPSNASNRPASRSRHC